MNPTKLLHCIEVAKILGKLNMGSFEKQVKERTQELKIIFKKGVKIVGDSCKKGWYKMKNMRS
ncbi:hypothetical protein KY290_004790 [Solanum tuberosum]|uniref:Uncharacterized protein n=1 Tax=Solanum tuberosum TaxID=4113 RepID=A0ABQ7WE24_SOLTU|nr:hypothetical protein KY284_004898 [Solanum tuberosum]KAH0778363.1 hypothetical protein KY290_004790 [Solanum tuberosum]